MLLSGIVSKAGRLLTLTDYKDTRPASAGESTKEKPRGQQHAHKQTKETENEVQRGTTKSEARFDHAISCAPGGPTRGMLP